MENRFQPHLVLVTEEGLRAPSPADDSHNFVSQYQPEESADENLADISNYVESDDDIDTEPEQGLAPKKAKIKGRRIPGRFLEDIDARTQRARRGGRSLQKQVKTYIAETHADVHFKAVYRYQNGSEMKFEAGEDFQFTTAGASPTTTLADIKSTISSSLTQAMQAVIPTTPLEPRQEATPTVFSPVGHVVRKSNPSLCILCNKKEVTDRLIRYKSVMIGCSVNSGGYVHADCVGFPGISEPDVRRLPDYYCSEHRQSGRMRKRVDIEFVDDNTTPFTPTNPAPRSRGRPKKL